MRIFIAYAEKKSLEAEYKKFQQRGLKLDMSRGKPSQEQLDLSMGMMDVLASYVDQIGRAHV